MTNFKKYFNLKIFFNNLRYLFRYNLKDFDQGLKKLDEVKWSFNHIKYELKQNLDTVDYSWIQKDPYETLEKN